MPDTRQNSLIRALSKRSFAQWMIAYAVAGWFLLEFLGFLVDTYGWDARLVRSATAAVISGTTVMGTLSWFHGQKGRQDFTWLGSVLLSLAITLVVATASNAWNPSIALSWLISVSLVVSLTIIGSLALWFRMHQSTFIVEQPSEVSTEDERNSLSIAVMRFESLGEVEPYLADGIVEEVIGQLSTLADLHVASRNSSYGLDDLAANPQKVGKLLNVAYVLNGVVQKYGDVTRVRASLVNTISGRQEWSNRYDTDDPNIFNLQDQIAQAVAESLAQAIGISEMPYQPTKRDTRAFQLFAKARFIQYTMKEDKLRSAVALYKEALEIDPDYTIAYSGLLESYMLLGFNYVKPSQILREAISTAVRASQLPDANSSIYRSLAFFNMVTGDFSAAEENALKAIKVKPDNAENHGFYSNFLTYCLRFDEAQKEIELMLKLDRASLFGLSLASYMNYFAGNFKEALSYADKVIELYPEYPLIHLWRGSAYELLGQFDLAMQDYRVERSVPMSARAHELRILAAMGKEEEARVALHDLLNPPANIYVDPYRIALVYVALGDEDDAFVWLNKAAEANSFHLSTIDAEPMLDPVRYDKRFEELRLKAGLTETSDSEKLPSSGLGDWLAEESSPKTPTLKAETSS